MQLVAACGVWVVQPLLYKHSSKAGGSCWLKRLSRACLVTQHRTGAAHLGGTVWEPRLVLSQADPAHQLR